MIRAEKEPATAGPPAGRRRRSGRRYRSALVVVGALSAAAAVGGALAGCHPTGIAAMDAVYAAALAAVVTLAASRASRLTLLFMTVLACGLARSWLWIPAGAALALAFGSTFQRRAHMRLSAVIGAVAVQVVLRWPSGGFHGFTALAAAVAVAPVLLSGWRHSPSLLRRRLLLAGGGVAGVLALLSLPVLVTGLLSKGPAEQGIALARDSLNRIESGDARSATAELRRAAGDMGTARTRMTGWWDMGGLIVPGVAQQERALYHGTRAGARLTATASRLAGSLDMGSLRLQHGRIDLAALERLQQPATDLDAAILTAQGELSQAGSPWLVAPIADHLTNLGRDLGRARNADELAAMASRDAPGLLGGDGVRHYFVAFMTPSETRGLGGFIGAYGELTVDHGSIHLTTSGRATQLVTAASPPTTLAAPADFVARYGRFDPQRHFEDLTYSPDFPSVEQAIAGLYPQVGGDHIDGAMVLDPYALAALLHFTGPITVPGFSQPLTYKNAAQVLLLGQYTSNPDASERHDILQSALKIGFGRLTTGSLPSPKKLSTILGPEVRQGRLLFWSSHPGDEALLQRLGLSGSFPEPGPASDVLAVTVANGGNSKIDAYLHQQVSDAVRYDPATGHVSSTVTIRLTNSAPASGLPPYVIGSHLPGLPGGTSLLWLSLYSPLRLTGAQSGGQPTTFTPGSPEDGVTAYSTYVTIPAQATLSLTVTLDGDVTPGSSYRLALRQQPLANPQTVKVSVTPPGGWLYRAGTHPDWAAGDPQVQFHRWYFAR